MSDLLVRAVVRRRGGTEAFTLDVDLRFAPGVTTVLGPSGAGKSTLLAAIAGLVDPDAGRIALGDWQWFGDGAPVVPAERRHVAYVFQTLALFPHMNAIHNVAYALPRSMARPERRRRARELLERLAVGHLAERRPSTYSGGEAQRVALARALAMSPKVILLDEPFSALNPELRIQLAQLVRTLVDDLGVPLLHVTHSISETRRLADRVVRMEAGAVVKEGTVAEVLGA